MTDDELIERLRRTLQTEAAAIAPNPADQPAAPYTVLAPASVLRRRWPFAITAAAAAVAAGVTLAVLNWPGGGASRIGVVAPGSSSSPAPTNPAPTLAPSSSVPPATTTVRTPTTVPASSTPATATTLPAIVVVPRRPAATVTTLGPAPSTPVSAAFQSEAVTFVSALEGWVAGEVPCGAGASGPAGMCLAMARTTNGGQTWTSAPAPRATISTAYGASPVSVRFADPMDGWIYAVNPNRVWSTHDGGSVWQQVKLADLGPSSSITAMEASGGYVWVAVLPPNVTTVHLERSPVATDAWTDVNTGVPIGAGPDPATQLVLHGHEGWLLQNDRTVVGGARLNGNGQWLPWTPPCATANGVAILAASSATDLVAMCAEGTWGPPHNLPPGAAVPSTWMFTSKDGGTTFQAVGAVPAGPTPAASNPVGLASPAPATVVAAGMQPPGAGGAGGEDIGVLSASFDGGHTWRTVLQLPSVVRWNDLGFTTLTQGVVVAFTRSDSTFSMTRDGGHTWTTAIP
jgi:hypothetical protein